jgi:hypothetical protein
MSAGSIVIDLLMKTGSFETDTKRAEKALNDFQKSAVKAGKAIGMALAGATTAIAAMVKSQINLADANIKLAQGAGTTVETLTSLGYAAQLSGSSTEELGRALGRLGKGVADAARGTGEASKAFDAMGISVKDANGQLKSSDQIFKEVAGKFSQYEDGAAKSALAMQIFGKEGAKLIPMLNAGADGLAAMEEEARALGVVMDSETAKAAEVFNDNLTRLNKVKEGLVNRIARELLPTLQNLTTRLFESAKSSGALDQAARAAAAGVRILLSVGAIVAGAMQTLGQSLGGVAAALVALFSGRFKDAFEIGRNVAVDFAGNIRGTMRTVESIWDTSGATIAASAQTTGGKIAAPLIAAAEETARAGRAVKQEIDRVQEAIQRTMAALSREVAILGMSGTEVRLFDFAAMGANPEQIAQARAMLDTIDEFEAKTKAAAEAKARQNAVMEEGRQVYDQTRSPAERLNMELAKLNDLLKAGAIDWDTYSRAVFASQDAFDATQKKVQEMDEFGKKAAENIQSYLGTAFADAMNGNFKNIGSAFTQMINRMVAEAMAAQLSRYLFGDMVGGTGGGVLGGVLSSIGGFFGGGRAGGGGVIGGRAYLVGENGPEMFVPRTAGTVVPNVGTSGSTSSMTINNNFTVSGNVDKRTQLQIAREAAMALQRGQRNM